jgi:2-iminobutanoate/2-iminopropanoate deaminase
MFEKITSSRAPAAIGPYSQATVVGGLVYTSGQIPIEPDTGNLPLTIELQAEQVFINIKHLLEDSGTSISQVIKTTVFLTDLKNFAKVNEIYARYFTEPYPARSCVEVSRLPKDVLIEVEAIAVK